MISNSKGEYVFSTDEIHILHVQDLSYITKDLLVTGVCITTDNMIYMGTASSMIITDDVHISFRLEAISSYSCTLKQATFTCTDARLLSVMDIIVYANDMPYLFGIFSFT